ncbi:MAG: leucyl/phenylalanyl-tRNA--protein transferase [Myxococcota bacterium]
MLIKRYSRGFFPWPTGDEPIRWYNPNPRFVLAFANFHIGKSLKKAIQISALNIRMDTCFSDVIHACSSEQRPEQDGTWIRDDIIKAYTQLHEKGFAHSIEAFRGDHLVGGLYGVSLGGVFFGESMFAHEGDASKIAFVKLVHQLQRWDFDFIDCQAYTEHLARFGATFWPREAFLKELSSSLDKPTRIGPWRFDS